MPPSISTPGPNSLTNLFEQVRHSLGAEPGEDRLLCAHSFGGGRDAHPLERNALDDLRDDVLELVAAAGGAGGNFLHEELVRIVEATAQGVGEHVFDEAFRKLVLSLADEHLAQLLRAVEGLASEQPAGGVHR